MLFDGLTHKAGTARTAMENRIGTAPTFAGRDAALIEPDERQEKMIEEARRMAYDVFILYRQATHFVSYSVEMSARFYDSVKLKL